MAGTSASNRYKSGSEVKTKKKKQNIAKVAASYFFYTFLKTWTKTEEYVRIQVQVLRILQLHSSPTMSVPHHHIRLMQTFFWIAVIKHEKTVSVRQLMQ